MVQHHFFIIFQVLPLHLFVELLNLQLFFRQKCYQIQISSSKWVYVYAWNCCTCCGKNSLMFRVFTAFSLFLCLGLNKSILTSGSCIWSMLYETDSPQYLRKNHAKRKSMAMLLRRTFWSQSNIHGECIRGSSFSSTNTAIAHWTKRIAFICWWFSTSNEKKIEMKRIIHTKIVSTTATIMVCISPIRWNEINDKRKTKIARAK